VTGQNGTYLFAELFKKYQDEVSPACKVVMVSFLNNLQGETQLMGDLQRVGVAASSISQFRFNQARPDLTKIDAMLGLLSSDTQDFALEVHVMAERIAQRGITEFIEWEANRTARKSATFK